METRLFSSVCSSTCIVARTAPRYALQRLFFCRSASLSASDRDPTSRALRTVINFSGTVLQH